ncbi:MAG: ribulokinase [Bacteroidales bacterium]
MKKKLVLGLDYGTDSVRALIVDAANGEEIASAVSYYPRWIKRLYCNPSANQFRQHPQDYIDSMENAVREALSLSPEGTGNEILAISIDTTGSTPVAVDQNCMPLSLKPQFAENPNAMFILWKDHTAVAEADQINHVARTWGGTDFTKYEGGVYSSEWFWSKVLHILRTDEAVKQSAWSWMEHCDWMPALLTGETKTSNLKISRCAAGHKAMWHQEWGGLPPKEFLQLLDPSLSRLRDRLYSETYTSDVKAGDLSAHWAARLNLKPGIAVGVGAFDAHLGAVGGEIKPYYLSKVMGTSTCDMVVVPEKDLGNSLVKGICGQVDGSVIPGMIGLEAGQSAFGDVYAWFRDLLLWPVKNIFSKTPLITPQQREEITASITQNLIEELTLAAGNIDPDKSGLIALDWLNGRRTPDADQFVSGAVTGITLGTDAPAIFRALVEATAFGSRAIIERFRSEGVRIDGVIALGGVAKKSPLVMQIVSDVLDMPIEVARNEQTVALGAAMAASVVAGIHPDFRSAQKAMGSGVEKVYRPRAAYSQKYNKLYEKYKSLGNFMERVTPSE